MIVDVRTYRVKPGKMPQELDLYAKRGLAAQIRHLGPPLAYLHGESGDINAIVHLWVFEDAADRARTRYGGAEGYRRAVTPPYHYGRAGRAGACVLNSAGCSGRSVSSALLCPTHIGNKK